MRMFRKQAISMNRNVMRQKKRRNGLLLTIVFGISTLLPSCMVGPNYVQPAVEAPAAYKEIDGWKVAQPQDAVIRGTWWEMFNDPQLNALEAQIDISNQNVATAEAQFRQARALVREARAGLFPTVTIGSGVTNTRTPALTSGLSARTT